MKLPHIYNLYKDQTVLMFKEVFCLEKIHGTACSLMFDPIDSSIHYASGGESHERFVKLFDETKLVDRLKNLGLPPEK